MRGSDSDWYRMRATRQRYVWGCGKRISGQAEPITDPARVEGVVEMFRARYGAGEVKRYYSQLDVALEVPLT